LPDVGDGTARGHPGREIPERVRMAVTEGAVVGHVLETVRTVVARLVERTQHRPESDHPFARERPVEVTAVWLPAVGDVDAVDPGGVSLDPIEPNPHDGSSSARHATDAQSDSIRASGSSGPGRSGEGKMLSTAGRQFVAARPLRRTRPAGPGSSPSLNSRIAIPSAPAVR
jgi:hypothetical protein